jgi:hypothetical protein
LSPVDVLPSLLELAIALAGFAGVVAALQSQATWSSHADILFSALLGSTFLSACLSVLAMVLHASPIESSATWIITSFVHAVLLTLVITLRVLQVRRGDFQFTKDMQFTACSFMALILIQLGNAFLFERAWICVSALAFYAFFGFLYFVLLLAEIRSEKAG